MKKILFVMLAVILMIVVIPVHVDAAKKKYKIKANAIYEIAVDEKITLYVNTELKVTWSSSDKSVAKVDKKGVVTGVSGGECIIKAKTKKKTYKCTIKVVDRVTIVTTITISPHMSIDDIEAELEDRNYAISIKEDAINPNMYTIISYTSNDPEYDEEDLQKLIYDIMRPELGYWSSESELSYYGVSVNRSKDIYIIVNDRIITLTGIPNTLVSGVEYESGGIRYKYEGQLYLKTEDLVSAGIVNK